jgi:outer membrane protein assembly factor BamE (lipoprotein component of BamABCDE complex)
MSKKMVLFAAALLAACGVTVVDDTKFNVAYVDNIVTGRTTKAEILANMGNPKDSVNSSSVSTWLYSYEQRTGNAAANVDAEGHTVRIQFNGDVVSSCSHLVATFKGGWVTTQRTSNTYECGKSRL